MKKMNWRYSIAETFILYTLFLNDATEREKLELDVRSRLLFTYRKGFKAIGELCEVLQISPASHYL